MPDTAVDVHLPGGVLTSAQVQALAELAHTHAGGDLHLTGHAQMRLWGDPDLIADGLRAAGLMVADPARGRILASPLSGRLGGHRDIRGLARVVATRLEHAAGTPGAVYGIDDGTGDIVALAPHVAVLARPDGLMAVVREGTDTGLRVDAETAADVLLADLPTAGDTAGDRAGDTAGNRAGDTAGDTAGPEPLPTPPPTPIGWLDQTDGAVTLAGGLPGGVLPARTAEFLAAVERPLVVTPWRTMLLCDLDEWTAEQVVRVLAPMGLVFDAHSPLLS